MAPKPEFMTLPHKIRARIYRHMLHRFTPVEQGDGTITPANDDTRHHLCRVSAVVRKKAISVLA